MLFYLIYKRFETDQGIQVNILAFLSSTIFNDAINAGATGLTGDSPKDLDGQKKALGMSLGFGLANFVFTYFAWRGIDKRAGGGPSIA